MTKDFQKRLTLTQKFEKLLSLGIWSPDLSPPEPQMLERIQRLNNEIEKRIYELYIPDGQQEKVISEIKEDMLSESQQRKQKIDLFAFPLDWEHLRRTNFVHLGEGVSTWLNDREPNTELLIERDLPVIENAEGLSQFLDKSIQQIKWFAYHRKTANTLTYTDFNIPKKTGGYRHLSKPNKVLMVIQRKIQREILNSIKFPDYVTGFVKKRNNYQNARTHTKGSIIVNIDIKNYFSSIRFYQVRSVFHNLGYSGEIATVLALLTTKQDATKVEIEDRTVWSMSQTRKLPQGSPTSPLIANLVGLKIDKQLKKRSEKLGFLYSRYADDMTFSTTKKDADIKALLYMARKTLELHGFKANPKKTKVMFKNDRQEVTGLIINSGNPRVPREWRRRLRAAVHQFKFIEDKEEMEKEYRRITGCLQYLRWSHPQEVHKYERELIRHYGTL